VLAGRDSAIGASLSSRAQPSNFEHTRAVTLLSIALLIGFALPGSEPHVEPVLAKRMIKPSPRRPPPPPPPPDMGGDVAYDVPPGPEEGGVVTAEVGPLVEATATVWAQAGSRSWTGCSAVADEASKQLWSVSEDVNNFQANHHWAVQAVECPNAPEVLTMAIRSELMRRFDLPEAVDGKTDLTLIEQAVIDSRSVALDWITDARTELERRQDDRTFGLEYWHGRALLSTGDLEGAQQAFEKALAEHSVESWRLRRLLALTLLYRGELDGALIQAFRAVIDSPSTDRYMADYVLALVLDRAGDTAGSRRRMKETLDRDGDLGRMRSLESALPIHERLYLRAFAQTVRNEPSGAIRLWDAYLARPEPEAPERRLAERHRQALEPLPTNLGGPPKPGEAPNP
jgi:tetratricopeptide (TPR) repeat protein